MPPEILSHIAVNQSISLQLGDNSFPFVQQDIKDHPEWFFLANEKMKNHFIERMLLGWKMSLLISKVPDITHVYPLLDVEKAMKEVNNC